MVALARARGPRVIEVWALALGSEFGGRALGGFGAAAIFSFELSKTIPAGWGGILVANDPALVREVDRLHSSSAFLPRGAAARLALQVALSHLLYHPHVYGIGRHVAAALYRSGVFRVSTPRAATKGRMAPESLARLADAHWHVIHRQLANLDALVSRAQRAAAVYRDVLQDHGVTTFPVIAPTAVPAWARFPFLVDDRAAMMDHFRAR